MRLLGQDKRLRSMKLFVSTLDDLWHLYNIILPGDKVTATTQRTVTLDRGIDAGEEKVRRKTMTLTVEVERVEFHDFANRLRVLGSIVGGDEQGRHHTLNIEPLDELSIAKPTDWKDHHIARVQEAVRAAESPKVVFVAIEDGEATLAVLRQYGLQEVGVVAGPGSGKRTGKEEDRGPWFGEIHLGLKTLIPDSGTALVVGPGFTKDQFLAWMKDKHPDMAKRVLVDSTAHAGVVGIREAMKRGLVDRVDKEARVAVETRMVEKVMEAIGMAKPSAYGEAEVKRALDLGAANLLLVTDRMVREGNAEALLALAKGTQCEAHVISTGHEAGKRLDLMGGAAALLRYAMAPPGA